MADMVDWVGLVFGCEHENFVIYILLVDGTSEKLEFPIDMLLVAFEEILRGNKN